MEREVLISPFNKYCNWDRAWCVCSQQEVGVGFEPTRSGAERRLSTPSCSLLGPNTKILNLPFSGFWEEELWEEFSNFSPLTWMYNNNLAIQKSHHANSQGRTTSKRILMNKPWVPVYPCQWLTPRSMPVRSSNALHRAEGTRQQATHWPTRGRGRRPTRLPAVRPRG